MSHKKPIRIACLLFAVSCLFATSAVANDIGFTGNYASGTWTYLNNGYNGSGSITPTTMTITGGGITNGCCYGPSDTTYTNHAAYNGTISFNWSFSNPDPASGYDFPFYLVVNGVQTNLNIGQNGTTSGTLSFHLNSGDLFGFGVHSVDQGYTSATLTISNFTAVADTPEPASLLLMGTGLIGAAGALRRRFIA